MDYCIKLLHFAQINLESKIQDLDANSGLNRDLYKRYYQGVRYEVLCLWNNSFGDVDELRMIISRKAKDVYGAMCWVDRPTHFTGPMMDISDRQNEFCERIENISKAEMAKVDPPNYVRGLLQTESLGIWLKIYDRFSEVSKPPQSSDGENEIDVQEPILAATIDRDVLVKKLPYKIYQLALGLGYNFEIHRLHIDLETEDVLYTAHPFDWYIRVDGFAGVTIKGLGT